MRLFASFFFWTKKSVFNDLKKALETEVNRESTQAELQEASRGVGVQVGCWKVHIQNDVCNDLTNGKTTPKIEVLSICVVRCFLKAGNQRWEQEVMFFFCWNLFFLPCRWMGLLTLVTTKSMMRWCLLIVPDCWTFPTGSVFLSGIWWFRFLQLDFFFARAVCAWKLLFEQQRVLEFLRSISLRDFEITCVMWLGYQLGSKTDPFWCVHNFGIF